jgi:hypothetical protein
MRVLLVLLLVTLSTPAAAASFDDLYGWLFAANDRSASKRDPLELAAAQSAPEPGLSTSFLEDTIAPDSLDPQDRLPQIPDRGIPLDLPDHGSQPTPVELADGDGRVTSPVPEPTGALLFAAGTFLVARRLRARHQTV